jgi:periplasmic divalent cation tolerance protein
MFLCWTTVATRADADQLASTVIAANLAACVQIDGPVTSHYRWEGRAERADEFRLCFKALPAQLAALTAHVLAHHPYDIPEWIVVHATHVAEKYLSWAEANSTFPPFHTSQPPL